jgi:hypothetical protein
MLHAADSAPQAKNTHFSSLIGVRAWYIESSHTFLKGHSEENKSNWYEKNDTDILDLKILKSPKI